MVDERLVTSFGNPSAIDRVPKRLRKFHSNNDFTFLMNTIERTFTRAPLQNPVTENEVIVINMHRALYENILIPMMESAGRIKRITMSTFPNGSNRGICYIEYQNRRSAIKACRIFNNTVIATRLVEVKRITIIQRLYVGLIPKHISYDAIIKALMANFVGVTQIKLHLSQKRGEHNAGFAFVQFHSHELAAEARKQRLYLWGTVLGINWITPKH